MSRFDKEEKENAKEKAKKKAKSVKSSTTSNVSSFILNKAEYTKEQESIKLAKENFLEEEEKRIVFLKNPDSEKVDDHGLTSIFVELVFFLKNKNVELKNFMKIFKPFDFNNPDSITIIQQLLRYIKKDPFLRREFIKTQIKDYSEDDNDDNDEYFDDDYDEKRKQRNKELDSYFDRFYNVEDDKQTRSSFGIGKNDVGRSVYQQNFFPTQIKKNNENNNKLYDENLALYKERREIIDSEKPIQVKVIQYDRDTKLKSYSDKIGLIKNISFTAFIHIFDDKDAKQISDEIFKRTIDENGTLYDFLLRLARIAVFVNNKYLKSIAKTFNAKLSRGYYNLNSLLDLSLYEILQEIYEHPDNQSSLSDINKKVSEQIEIYIQSKLKILDRTPYNKDDHEKEKESLQSSLESIKKSPSLNKSVCSEDFSEVDDVDIIYYTDTTNGSVYCFKLFDLYEQFEQKDFINHKTGLQFTDIFVQNILSHHKKPKSPIKEHVRLTLDDLKIHDDDDDDDSIFMKAFQSIEKGLSDDIKKEYFEKFNGPFSL